MGSIPNMGPILRTSRSSVGACIRNMDRTSLHAIRRSRSTKGHTIRQYRTGRTSHSICMECMPTSSNGTGCCTMGRNVCSSTMNFLCCKDHNMTMGRCCCASHTGCSLHLLLYCLSPCRTIFWQTCHPESSRYPSSLQKDICLKPWSSPSRLLSQPSTPAFRPLT